MRSPLPWPSRPRWRVSDWKHPAVGCRATSWCVARPRGGRRFGVAGWHDGSVGHTGSRHSAADARGAGLRVARRVRPDAASGRGRAGDGRIGRKVRNGRSVSRCPMRWKSVVEPGIRSGMRSGWRTGWIRFGKPMRSHSTRRASNDRCFVRLQSSGRDPRIAARLSFPGSPFAPAGPLRNRVPGSILWVARAVSCRPLPADPPSA